MREWTKSLETPVQIVFAVFDRFSNHCLANTMEPMRTANLRVGADAFQWKVLSPSGDPVRSSSGLPILPDGALSHMPPCDYLFVMPSYDHLVHDTGRNRTMLVRAARQSKFVVGLDTGPWLLASAGLLDGYKATLHAAEIDAFAETFPNVQTLRQQVVDDGRMLTCAGVMAAFDLTLLLIRRHMGEAVALDINRFFLRDSDAPVTPSVQDQLVSRALTIMEKSQESPLSLHQIARSIGCQPKTMERRFQAALGASPGVVYRHMRLTTARHLVQNTRQPLAQVALAVGFQTPAALSRAYRDMFGNAPSQDRSNI
jgi:AraC family carnitine catabolism transcriptional activator